MSTPRKRISTHRTPNQSKMLVLAGICALFAVIGIALLFHAKAASPFVSSEPELAATIATPATKVADSTASGGMYVKFAANNCGVAGGTCTAAEVAAHGSQTNCWVIYSGSYYNVTTYVNQHNGGPSVFNSTTCGHDITSYLSGSASTAGTSHGHSTSAYNTLATYKVGPVVN